MNVVLVSTYELGRQPFGLASPAAWLRRAGFAVTCCDVSRGRLQQESVETADLVAFFLPMHTATRLAVPLIERVRTWNPAARICCYGLYGPLNRTYLESLGVDFILGGEFEADLVDVAMRVRESRRSSGAGTPAASRVAGAGRIPRLQFVTPDRSGLPPLDGYAQVVLPDGRTLTAGYTEASRGCKHLCRHCPIVPVYNGAFRVVDPEVVLADVEAQVLAGGAAHITFGDPDFYNGIGHARRVMREFGRRFPGITYDVTIKIEHLLKHRADLPVLPETGCLFVTSAVESLDNHVLALLRKGHTRADFERALDLCRAARLSLRPTFIAFTPWTTLATYAELLDTIDVLDLVEEVPPIQYAIRLLITSGSHLLELDDIRAVARPFEPATLTHPWRHPDPRVDALQEHVWEMVAEDPEAPRSVIFERVRGIAERASGIPACRTPHIARAAVPYLTEPWYC
jgi:radical SAM superfamily enzyme YgiQ (UPF0313 family)